MFMNIKHLKIMSKGDTALIFKTGFVIYGKPGVKYYSFIKLGDAIIIIFFCF